MSEIVLRFKVDGDQLTVIDQAGDKIKSFGRTAQESAGGLSGMVKGAADLWGAFQTLNSTIGMGAGIISNLNETGKAAIRANEALGALSGGQADKYLNAMRTASGGVIDNLNLARDATQALSTGAVKNIQDMQRLTAAGSTLGEVFQGEAAAGVEALTRDIEMVGSARGLKQLGIDATAVKTEFESLKRTMSDQDAWRMAVLDVASKNADALRKSMSGAGDELERAETDLKNMQQDFSKAITIGIDIDIRSTSALGKAIIDNPGQAAKLLANSVADAAHMPRDVSGDAFQTAMMNAFNAPGSPGSAMYGPPAALAAPSTGMTDSERSARNSMRSVPTGGQQDPSVAGWVAEAERYNKALQGSNSNWREAVGLSATVAANTAKIAADAKNASITSTAIGGEVSGFSGGLASDAQAVRDQLKRGGVSEKQLESFDATAKLAMDNYALSTGAATKESLTFRDIHEQLSKSVANGAMSFSQEAATMAQLANAYQSGALSAHQLAHEMDVLQGNDDHLKITRGRVDTAMTKGNARDRATLRDRQLEEGLKTGTTTNAGDVNNDFSNVALPDPVKLKAAYDPLIDSASKAQAANTAIGTTAIGAVPNVARAGAGMALGLAPYIAALVLANQLQGGLGQFGRGGGHG